MKIDLEQRLLKEPEWVEMAEHLGLLLKDYPGFDDYSFHVRWLTFESPKIRSMSEYRLTAEENSASVSIDREKKQVVFAYTEKGIGMEPKLAANIACDIFDQIIEAGEEE